jgi:thioester reductase-like protein
MPKTILLTGASGVVGTAMLPELEQFEVIALTHKGTVAAENVEAHRSDVTKPRLGLSQGDFEALARRVDAVLHTAGLIDFGAAQKRHQAINVEGVRHVTEFAKAADAPVHHVSTSYILAVTDQADRRLAEDNLLYDYCKSKVDGERVLRESGVPHTIYRPSNVIGDSRTGHCSPKDFFPGLAMGVLKGRYPMAPSRPGARVDMVPEDVMAQAVARAVAAEDIGSEYWLTYGEESMTLPEMVDLMVEFAQRIGKPIDPPTIFDPDDPKQVEEGIERLPRVMRRLFTRMIYPRLMELSDGMTAVAIFPTSLPELAERYDVPRPDLRDTARLTIEYVARAKGIIEQAPAGAH